MKRFLAILFSMSLTWLAFPIKGVMALEKKGEVIELVFSSSNPPVAPIVQSALHWFEVVKKETKGKVQFKVVTGGALLTEQEVFRGIQSGVADIATYIVDERDGFVLNSVITLPFLKWPSREKANEIYETLIQRIPEVKAEWRGVLPFALSMMPPNHIHMRKKQVRTPADLKGQKIAVTGKYASLLKALGAIPVEVPIQDWYYALERGVVDGCLNHFAVLKVFQLLDLVNTHTLFGPGGVNMGALGIIMNEKAWESLPKDVQEVFVHTQREYTRKLYEIEETQYLQAAIEHCKTRGHTFVELSPDEITAWQKLVQKPIVEQWIKDCEKKGLPGKKVYEEMIRMIEGK